MSDKERKAMQLYRIEKLLNDHFDKEERMMEEMLKLMQATVAALAKLAPVLDEERKASSDKQNL